MDERALRMGRTEAVARMVNNGLYGHSNAATAFEIMCECGDADCVEPLQVTRGDYARLRLRARHFAIIPGHIAIDVEDLVERHDGYDVVSKHRDAVYGSRGQD